MSTNSNNKEGADEKGNQFERVSNVRVTYVSQRSRSGATDWSEGDVVRLQAYKANGGLHMGPELALESPDTILELVEALCRLYRAQVSRATSQGT